MGGIFEMSPRKREINSKREGERAVIKLSVLARNIPCRRVMRRRRRRRIKSLTVFHDVVFESLSSFVGKCGYIGDFVYVREKIKVSVMWLFQSI